MLSGHAVCENLGGVTREARHTGIEPRARARGCLSRKNFGQVAAEQHFPAMSQPRECLVELLLELEMSC